MAGGDSEPVTLEETPYGYVPKTYVCIVFLALFGLSTVAHLVQATYHRMWWLLPTVCLCGTLEVIGWSARLWSSSDVLKAAPFETQVTATIIAPTLLAGANTMILRYIILTLGPAYSRLTPKMHSIVFGGFDLLSLLVQALGGGLVSVATSNEKSVTKGVHVMLIGIILHLVSLIFFAAYTSEFFVRYSKDKPLRQVTLENSTTMRGFMSRRIQIMCIGLTFVATFLLVRAIYRTVELIDGWEGTVFRTEMWFDIFDATMVFLAMITLNIAHPGLTLTSPESKERGNYGLPPDMHSTRSRPSNTQFA